MIIKSTAKNVANWFNSPIKAPEEVSAINAESSTDPKATEAFLCRVAWLKTLEWPDKVIVKVLKGTTTCIAAGDQECWDVRLYIVYDGEYWLNGDPLTPIAATNSGKPVAMRRCRKGCTPISEPLATKFIDNLAKIRWAYGEIKKGKKITAEDLAKGQSKKKSQQSSQGQPQEKGKKQKKHKNTFLFLCNLTDPQVATYISNMDISSRENWWKLIFADYKKACKKLHRKLEGAELTHEESAELAERLKAYSMTFKRISTAVVELNGSDSVANIFLDSLKNLDPKPANPETTHSATTPEAETTQSAANPETTQSATDDSQEFIEEQKKIVEELLRSIGNSEYQKVGALNMLLSMLECNDVAAYKEAMSGFCKLYPEACQAEVAVAEAEEPEPRSQPEDPAATKTDEAKAKGANDAVMIRWKKTVRKKINKANKMQQFNAVSMLYTMLAELSKGEPNDYSKLKTEFQSQYPEIWSKSESESDDTIAQTTSN